MDPSLAPTPLRRTASPRRAALVLAGAMAAVLLVAGPVAAQVGGPIGPSTTEDDRPATTERETTTTTTTEDAPDTTRAEDGSNPTEAEADGGGQDGSPTGDEGSARAGDDSSNGVLLAVGGVIGGLVLLGVGLLVGMALGRRKTPAAAPAGLPTPPPLVAPAAATPAAPPPAAATAAGGPVIGPAPDRDVDRLRSQRAALVGSLIDLADRLPSDALRDEVARSLTAAGVEVVAPDGEPFDPAIHHAVAQVPATDGSHNTIASTERPGYRDGSTLLRAPDVVVRRSEGQP